MVNMRVNIGAIGNHWSNTAEEGGRLLGEGVHFFDLANWMMDASPIAVSASFLGEVDPLNPDASVRIRYRDGSIATLVYTSIGNVDAGKEYFELFGNGKCVRLDDYKSLTIHGRRGSPPNGKGQKGQAGAIDEFAAAVLGQATSDGADANAGLLATAIFEAALESARIGAEVEISRH